MTSLHAALATLAEALNSQSTLLTTRAINEPFNEARPTTLLNAESTR